MCFLDDFGWGSEFLGSKAVPNTILGHQMYNKAPTKGPKNFTCSKIGTFGYLGVIAQNERLLGGNIVQYHTIMGETLVINGGGWLMSVASLSLRQRFRCVADVPLREIRNNIVPVVVAFLAQDIYFHSL